MRTAIAVESNEEVRGSHGRPERALDMMPPKGTMLANYANYAVTRLLQKTGVAGLQIHKGNAESCEIGQDLGDQ